MKIQNSSAGVTLIEMIIVILIVAILGAVAYRTVDTTSFQAKFDATKKEMRELVKGFVGNPDLTSDGRRIDFGYVGDMGRLPQSLSALIRADGPNWKGPYIRNQFIQDTLSFKTDAWGKEYEYNRDELLIRSLGARETLTVKISNDTVTLFANRITGTISDINGLPPVEFASRITIRLKVPYNGEMITYEINPRRDGFYEFAPPTHRVPIGYHMMIVKKEYGSNDSIIRWISVPPRSNIVADFRFATGFRNNLKFVEGSSVVWGSDSCNVGFRVFNIGDDLTLDSLVVTYLDTTAYYEEVRWEGIEIWNYSSPPPHRNGVGDVAVFNPRPNIEMNKIARFDLMGFKDEHTAPTANPVNMTGIRITIKFSDGSTIDFIP